jgi:hypothetical protein
LLIYGKAEAANISAEEKRQLSKIAAEIKAASKASAARASDARKGGRPWQRRR